MDISRRFATDNYGQYSLGINADLPSNSVPAVCEARPGVLTTADQRLVSSFG